MNSYGNQYGNAYQEVRHVRGGSASSRRPGDDIFSRICASLCCSLIGFGLFLGSLAGAAFNEERTVCVARALEEGRRRHKGIGCALQQDVLPGTDPVFFACEIAEESLRAWTPRDFGAEWLDGAFEIRSVKVHQEVQAYQCEEKRRTEEVEDRGGVKTKIDTYTYEASWSMHHISSHGFRGFQNGQARRAMEEGCGRHFVGNPAMPMGSKSLHSDSLRVGGYDLSRHFGKLSADVPITLRQGSYLPPNAQRGGTRHDSRWERRLARDGKSYTREEFIDYYGRERGLEMWDEARERPAETPSAQSRVTGNSVQTCEFPEIGCLRVSFLSSDARHASHLAALDQAGGAHATKPWAAPPSWLCSSGGTASQVDLFAAGLQSASELVDSSQRENTTMCWLLRLASVACAVFGIHCMLQPIQAVADFVDRTMQWFWVIPVFGPLLDFLGNVISGAVGWGILLISLGIGAPCALTVIGLVWFLMRPLLALFLLAPCAAILAFTIQKMRQLAKEGRQKRGNKVA